MKSKLFIDGDWSVGEGEELISTNPVNGQVVWKGKTATESQVDLAMQSAKNAFKDWALLPYEQREATIKRYQQLLQENLPKIANDILLDTGKALWECQGEVKTMIAKVDVSIKAYQERTGDRQIEGSGFEFQLQHRPKGVCVVFGPFNFPGHLPNGHIIPALLAGNAIVFKPSEETPRIACRMVELLHLAGMPKGVVNLVIGQLTVAKQLVSHPLMDALFFTGSSSTGKIIHQSLGGQVNKLLALEMGGNNPLIVLDDVDIEAAVYHIIMSAFVTAGQRCTCARRLIVPVGQKGDKLIAALIEKTKTLDINLPDSEPAPFYSTVINTQTADKMLAVEADLMAKGAKSLLKMQKLNLGEAFVSPAIVDVTGVDAPDEEYFGPLLQIYRVANLEEAIAQANQTRFGLSAGIFTEDEAAWQQFYQLSNAGVVNWNRPLTGASGALPFGGTGDSGNQRPSAYYAADYCAYPVATMLIKKLELPATVTAGYTK